MESRVILSGIAVSLLGYLIQVRPRFYNRYFGVDTWRNLSIADYIRRHKRLPDELPKYMLKGPFDYPPLLNILLALFPKRFVEDYQGFISPLFDFLNNIVVFAVTYLLTNDLSVAVFAQLAYALTPITAIENSSLNARSLGGLLFSLSFLSGIFYSINHKPLMLILAIVATTALLFSQKMAAQTLFLLSFGFSVLEKNFIYLIIVGLSAILAVLISGGFYLRILRGQFSVLKYFRLIIKDRYSHQVRGALPTLKNRDFIELIKATIRQYPLFALIGSCPLIALGFFISIWMLLYPANSLLAHYPGLSLICRKFALWLVLLYSYGIITAWLKPFQFLGEGMKYIVYAALPSSFIVSVTATGLLINSNNPNLLLFVIAILLFSLLQINLLQNQGVIKDTTRTITASLRQVMDFLEKQPGEVRLATIPFSLSDSIAYFTKSNILSSDSAYVLAHNPDYLDYYPVLRKPLEGMLNKHGINYFLVDKNYVNLNELNLSRIDTVLEAGNLCLLKW
jgi:hypothetical protein